VCVCVCVYVCVHVLCVCMCVCVCVCARACVYRLIEMRYEMAEVCGSGKRDPFMRKKESY
jgi:hypothetical protein